MIDDCYVLNSKDYDGEIVILFQFKNDDVTDVFNYLLSYENGNVCVILPLLRLINKHIKVHNGIVLCNNLFKSFNNQVKICLKNLNEIESVEIANYKCLQNHHKSINCIHRTKLFFSNYYGCNNWIFAFIYIEKNTICDIYLINEKTCEYGREYMTIYTYEKYDIICVSSNMMPTHNWFTFNKTFEFLNTGLMVVPRYGSIRYILFVYDHDWLC